MNLFNLLHTFTFMCSMNFLLLLLLLSYILIISFLNSSQVTGRSMPYDQLVKKLIAERKAARQHYQSASIGLMGNTNNKQQMREHQQRMLSRLFKTNAGSSYSTNRFNPSRISRPLGMYVFVYCCIITRNLDERKRNTISRIKFS